MAEKEYIERGAVLADIDAAMKNNGLGYVVGQTMKRYIKRQHTADVVEVRHGVWVEHFSFGVWHYDCPFCDDGYATKERDNTPPNYCPNCGAKMDGATDNNVGDKITREEVSAG